MIPTATRRRVAVAVPAWTSTRTFRVLVQLAVVAVVAWMIAFLGGNLRDNLRATGLDTGYGYLDQPYGSDIPGSAFRPTQSVADALKVGYGNTLRIASVGIALALAIGVVVGVARLSTNFLVRSAAALYVETLRNIPAYLLVFFSFFVVIQQSLPPIDEAIEIVGTPVFSNRGLYVPWFDGHANAGAFVGVLGVAAAVAVGVAVWRTRQFGATGTPHHRFLWSFGVLAGIAAVGYGLLGAPVGIDLPDREGRLVVGGIQMHPSYAALLVALSLYTASHIAEIVRGALQAVPRGQTEAALAIGLSSAQRVRLVVLPQAFRIMVPPLANQFLNLTKNSSLAVAIGYYEITRVTQTAANNAAPAPQAYSVLMLLYLSFSLSISLVANLVNRRLRISTR
jgi:general L-amino acid transport system permease protein